MTGQGPSAGLGHDREPEKSCPTEGAPGLWRDREAAAGRRVLRCDVGEGGFKGLGDGAGRLRVVRGRRVRGGVLIWSFTKLLEEEMGFGFKSLIKKLSSTPLN